MPGIEFVSSKSVAGNTTTMPAHQAGDLIIVFAVNYEVSTGASAITRPSGWESGGNNSTNTAIRLIWAYASKIATNSSETVGTWTNAKRLLISVYRNVSSVGVRGVSGKTNSSQLSDILTYPAVTSQRPGDVSWIAELAVHSTATNVNSLPRTGVAVRDSSVTNTLTSDTNQGVYSLVNQDITVNTAGYSAVLYYELIPADNPPTVELLTSDQTLFSNNAGNLVFKADDIDDDVVEYEIEIEGVSNDFSILRTSTSAIDSGEFKLVGNPSGVHPFPSGENVEFKLYGRSRYYFDGSQGSITTGYTNPTNAMNGNESTYATKTSGSSTANSNYLGINGTTAPMDRTEKISSVYVANSYPVTIITPGRFNIYSNNNVILQGTSNRSSSGVNSDWYKLTKISGENLTWEELKNLQVRIHSNGTNNTFTSRIFGVFIEVFYELREDQMPVGEYRWRVRASTPLVTGSTPTSWSDYRNFIISDSRHFLLIA